MPPTPKKQSVKGHRTCLLSHARARRLAERKRTRNGTLNKLAPRDLTVIPNPHYGFRRETQEYKTTVARSRAEISVLLNKAISTFFQPALMPDERIRLFLDEHRSRTNVDGTLGLLLSFVSRLWPEKKTLSDVHAALYSILDDSTRYRPIPAARRTYIRNLEAEIDNHRRTTVRDSFSPEEEQRVGQSLLLACDLAGFSNERLTAMATVHAGRRGDYSKDFSAGWEREYVGLMSILASRDRSVLVEEDSERQGTTYVDFPRRLASRRRLEHLLLKIYNGSLRLRDNGPPTWHTVRGKQTNGPLTLRERSNRVLVQGWVTSATRELLGESPSWSGSLEEQVDLILCRGEYDGWSTQVGDALFDAARASGHTSIARRSVLRKAQAYAEMAGAIAARQTSGYYWTVEEEQAVASFLVNNRGMEIDWQELGRAVPTRTIPALKDRLQGKHSGGIKLLVREIAEKAAAEDVSEGAESEEDGGVALVGEDAEFDDEDAGLGPESASRPEVDRSRNSTPTHSAQRRWSPRARNVRESAKPASGSDSSTNLMSANSKNEARDAPVVLVPPSDDEDDVGDDWQAPPSASGSIDNEARAAPVVLVPPSDDEDDVGNNWRARGKAARRGTRQSAATHRARAQARTTTPTDQADNGAHGEGEDERNVTLSKNKGKRVARVPVDEEEEYDEDEGEGWELSY